MLDTNLLLDGRQLWAGKGLELRILVEFGNPPAVVQRMAVLVASRINMAKNLSGRGPF